MKFLDNCLNVVFYYNNLRITNLFYLMIFCKTKHDKAQFDKNGLICNLSDGN